METKKNKQANLESSKSLFLSIGLIAACALLAFAFNWESKLIVKLIPVPVGGPIEITAPITVPEPIKPEPNDPTAKQMIKNFFNIDPYDTPIDSTDIIFSDFEDEIITDEIKEEEEPIHDYVTKNPRFPGGNKALMVYVANHVIYPAIAKENNIEGTVHMKFEVTKTGRIGKVRVMNHAVDMLLQEAAISVIKTLPEFEPGMQNNKYVNVWFSIPISFKLN